VKVCANVECGIDFEPARRGDQKYCCERCQLDAFNARRRVSSGHVVPSVPRAKAFRAPKNAPGWLTGVGR
jgi:hypothetical protein